MERGSVATPFGRRAMTFGMLASQVIAGNIQPEQSIDKWKLFRLLCEAKTVVGVSDRSLAVLNALLSFYPGADLSKENGLVVFPSNAQLSLRAHGMAGTTLRRHLACLVETGLILRRDSPNGKRYARRGRNGAVGEAFGFDLSPLIARAQEFKAAAAELAAERQHLRLVRERLSLCRRDIAKLLELFREAAPERDWQAQQQHYQEHAALLPRKTSLAENEAVFEKLALIREDLANQLENLLNSKKMATNDRRNGCHIQNTQPDSLSESERCLGIGEETVSKNRITQDPNSAATSPDRRESSSSEQPQSLAGRLPPPLTAARLGRQIPLPMVLKACPQIADYAPAGRISSWKDLLTAAIVVRSMLDVSSDAYEEACSVLGYESAAAVIACILERADQINSPGGYLRDLTRRAKRQEFSIAAMLGALSRARAEGIAFTG
ncbi:plasmid replication protein RepC [Sinorhizobium numidicum]|uniref:Plasmid replication protein RepC n=1 Tax=Sinorhizobium numidicum TaxID=680248 RepID=A0ABY8CNN3_9HYPH|nr:plasmid replication protein RepC [Sinorhizobium numidicum]WEX74280.1 plasmid replication protein RepC [Sinorhizobium numidicum]WEX80266.1 plasmid replication protein RepC [Sinorhizobium numidicum]